MKSLLQGGKLVKIPIYSNSILLKVNEERSDLRFMKKCNMMFIVYYSIEGGNGLLIQPMVNECQTMESNSIDDKK
jgi:hypothetical protein